MAGIAESAELGVGTIYLYFRDKADLYGSVLLEKMKQVMGGMEQALKSSAPTPEALRAAVRSQFGYHDANPHFLEIFLNQQQAQSSPLHARHWEELETLKRRHLGLLTECLSRGQAAGEIRQGDPQLFATVFLGMTLQIIRQRARTGGRHPLADVADTAVDCFLHGASVAQG